MKDFFKKDSVWVGLVVGILMPVTLYAILLLLYHFLDTMGVFSDVGFAEDFRTRTLALVSICANLLVMQSYKKLQRRHETIRGLLIASMILVAIWFVKFGVKMLQF